ncbi:sodium/proline symporter [Nesterenkonia xinjiangensis]|uniref:Sodium/proline symporter n=1 Tax=Nesterenkonia xinjiangensis TaxID=225327 RepID=A0A7Z0GKF3_9MICC|nr:sodium/proline symporter [Nesterenkonia xinjiangensis]NYJ77577.1 sodium/proline symporter [Nesterenkonia xinjiangensis]
MSGNTEAPTVLAFTLYFVVVLIIGVWAYRKNSEMSDFAIGGRRLGTFVTAVSAKASDSSQWVFLGLPGAFYVSGMSNIWMILGLTLGFYLSWRLLAARLRDYSARCYDWRRGQGTESVTVPGFFANRFHSELLRSVSALIVIIFYVIYLGSAFLATGMIFNQVFGVSTTVGVIVGALVVMVYSSLGGFLASSYTDVLQGCLMFGSLAIISVAAVVHAGGPGAIVEAVQAENPSIGSAFAEVSLVDGEWLTESSFTVVAAVSGLAWAFGYFGLPHILARFMGMRSSKSAKNGARLGVFLSLTLLGFAAIIGFSAIAIFGGDLDGPENAYMELVSGLLPTWIAGVFLAGVVAAVMSTADSQLVVASTTLTEDFYRAFINKEASDRSLVWLSRAAVGLSTVIGVAIALQGGTILDLVGYAWAGFGAAFGPVLLAALYSRRTTWFGALCGMVGGGLTVVVYRQIDTIGLYELVPGFLVGVLALWLGNTLGPRPGDAMQRSFDQLSQNSPVTIGSSPSATTTSS